MTINQAKEITETLAVSNQEINGPRFEGFISDRKGRLGVGYILNEIGPKILSVSFCAVSGSQVRAKSACLTSNETHRTATSEKGGRRISDPHLPAPIFLTSLFPDL